MKMKPSTVRIYAFLGACLLASGLASAQQVTISRDSSLLAEPNAGAAVVAQLKQGATAEQIGKQGAWVNVKSASGTGWVYSFNVTYAPGSQAPVAGGGGGGAKRGVSTIGIRGLEEKELKAATFDGKQLDALDAFATGDQDAGGSGAKPPPRKGK